MVGDLRDWEFVSELFKQAQPETIIHYAEQPSAPFSMLDRQSAMLTLSNNLEVTAQVVATEKNNGELDRPKPEEANKAEKELARSKSKTLDFGI